MNWILPGIDDYYDGSPDQSRQGDVVKTLSVSNGLSSGDWKPIVFCPADTYAMGYAMKVSILPIVMFFLLYFCLPDF